MLRKFDAIVVFAVDGVRFGLVCSHCSDLIDWFPGKQANGTVLTLGHLHNKFVDRRRDLKGFKVAVSNKAPGNANNAVNRQCLFETLSSRCSSQRILVY